LGDGRAAEASAIICARVDAAREIRRQRFQAHQGIYGNAHMTARDIRRYCWLAEPVEALLRQAITKLGLFGAGVQSGAQGGADDRGPGV